MKPFKQIQIDVKYDESYARLRRLFELSVKRLVNSRLKVPQELAKINRFEEELDNLLQK